MSDTDRRRKVALILLLTLFLSVACTSNRISVIENEGTIYFENLTSSIELIARAHPEGCFSSSCTRPLEQSGSVRIDTERFALHFETQFVLQRDIGGACTADCGGGGHIEFRIGDVERGVYTVWLGHKKLGQLEVPLRGSTQRYLEFSTGATATPLPPPTPTPAPTDPFAYPPPEPTIVPTAHTYP